jgi:hypothetical protein
MVALTVQAVLNQQVMRLILSGTYHTVAAAAAGSAAVCSTYADSQSLK